MTTHRATTHRATPHPIRLGIVGAGIFAREAHLPALLSLADEFRIAAVYSRTRAHAQTMAAQVGYSVDVYDSLPALLARPDIAALDIVLPILAVPDAVEQALAAGKHVISEKPVAPDLATGRRLISAYRQHERQVWMIAENMRYHAPFVSAAEMIKRGDIGRPLVCSWALHATMTPQNKYYHTTWRHDDALPGGFLLDGGIHQMAALRMVMGDVAAVGASTAHFRPDLPPPDTLSVSLQFKSGALGTLLLTFAAGSPWPQDLDIVGEGGALRVATDKIEVTRGGKTETISFPPRQDCREDIRSEMAGFAAAIGSEQLHRNPPEECLRDLALLDAILRSAQTGRRCAPENA